ncbi:MAG: DNA/RNA non-specific endonuclease [Xenococcaceae cyanobacterium]
MGFDPAFIQGCEVSLPNLAERVRASAFNDGVPIDHTRFSIIFSEERKFAIVTAHNIDGSSIIPNGVIERRNQFRFDPDVPTQLQVDNERGYFRNPWDRGHLVRRRALHWGDQTIAEQADSESFFWTNIAPQHNRLHATAWGRIEDWILDFTDNNDKRVSIFTGPIFTPDDPELQNQPDELPIRIPAGFWKILGVKRGGELRAAAFLVWQRDFDQDNPVEFDPILEQVRVTTIEFLTGLSFESLREADPLRFGVEFEEERSRGIRAGSARSRTAAITCQEDIVL